MAKNNYTGKGKAGRYEQSAISRGIHSQMDAQALIGRLQELQRLESRNTSEQALEDAVKEIKALQDRIRQLEDQLRAACPIIHNAGAVYLGKAS